MAKCPSYGPGHLLYVEAVANFDLRNSREETILLRKDYSKQHDERVVSLV